MTHETVDERTDENSQNNQKSVIIDACVNGNVRNYLEQRGYEVLYVVDENPRMGDDEIKKRRPKPYRRS